MLPVSFDCPFLIVPLVFSHVYLLNIYCNYFANHNILFSDFLFCAHLCIIDNFEVHNVVELYQQLKKTRKQSTHKNDTYILVSAFMVVWLLTPLSTIFQLYRDDQLYWRRSTRRKPPTYRKSPSNLITYCCIEYSSPERELTTLVVIGTDCMGSIYNYPAINTTTVSQLLGKHNILRYLLYFGGRYNISRAA